MTRFFTYQLGFQVVWVACIFGAREGTTWLGPSAALLWILAHLRQVSEFDREAALVLFAGFFGLLADLVLIRVGQLEYAGLDSDALFGPLWIVALWMAFATSINVSFTWLRGRPGLAATMGALGGLVAYSGGRRLGVVAFDLHDLSSFLALVGVWAVAIPLLVYAGQCCEGRPQPVRVRAS